MSIQKMLLAMMKKPRQNWTLHERGAVSDKTINPNKPIARPSKAICDCHVHVFETTEAYPFENVPAYEPPLSPLSRLRETGDIAGVSRFVLVQPTPYGRDPALLLASLKTMGNRAKGIAVADASISLQDLEKIQQAGVAGLRFIENLLPNGQKMPGAVSVEVLIEKLAPLLKELGMHAEIWGPLPRLTEYWPKLDKIGIPVVLDHMGGVDVASGLSNPDFQNLLARVKEGNIWVKLAVCRRGNGDNGFDAVRAFHDAFISANSEQLLWATDFPFVKYATTPPKMSDLIAIFRSWVKDEAVIDQILVRNPMTRYGFRRDQG